MIRRLAVAVLRLSLIVLLLVLVACQDQGDDRGKGSPGNNDDGRPDDNDQTESSRRRLPNL